MSTELLGSIERVLGRRDDADAALEDAVAVLAEADGLSWAGIAFLEEGVLILGPSAGDPDERRRSAVPITYDGSLVGELRVDGAADPAVLERVAVLVAPYVLIGWDTGGEPWDP